MCGRVHVEVVQRACTFVAHGSPPHSSAATPSPDARARLNCSKYRKKSIAVQGGAKAQRKLHHRALKFGGHIRV